MKKVTIELKEEAGITNHSLFNAKVLTLAHGPVKHVYLYGDSQHCDYLTSVTFSDGTHFDLTGFSWGYGGTGPHGLERFFEMAGIVCGIKSIMSWPEKGLKKTI